jgi:hypothetical protein
MSSAAFSMPSGSHERLSLQRRLKNPVTATAAAADEAIEQVLQSRYRRRRRRDMGGGPEREPSFLTTAIDSVTGTVADSMARFGLGPWLFRIVTVLGVTVVLGGGVWAVFLSGPPRHSVGGVALFEGKPLANAVLEFHLRDPSRPFTHTLTTGPDGSFHTEEAGLPAGMYAVVVTPPAPAALPAGRTSAQPPFPKAYRDPATTPLRIDLMEEMPNMRVFVRKGR